MNKSLKTPTLISFLRTEISNKEVYEAIVYFLKSHEIREGKFEANMYIIHKLSRETVILYQEHETPNGIIHSRDAQIIGVVSLLAEIEEVNGRISDY